VLVVVEVDCISQVLVDLECNRCNIWSRHHGLSKYSWFFRTKLTLEEEVVVEVDLVLPVTGGTGGGGNGSVP
jgi:hypothetical protein